MLLAFAKYLFQYEKCVGASACGAKSVGKFRCEGFKMRIQVLNQNLLEELGKMLFHKYQSVVLGLSRVVLFIQSNNCRHGPC